MVALFGALSQFRFVFGGFYAKDLRPLVAHDLARPYSIRQTAYDLRHLIRKGLVERLPRGNRYRLTSLGRRLVLFTAKLYHRVFCRGIARLQPSYPEGALHNSWRRFETQVDLLIGEAHIAA